MCGRYVLVQKIEVLESRFNVIAPTHFEWSPNHNISIGDFAPVITQDNPKELTLFRFGLQPFWAKKSMYLFNARAEGDKNKENNPDYKGGKGIISKASFKKPIRSQRCLVIADAFVEGSTKNGLDDAHLVFLKNKQRPFAFAGIYDTFVDKETGEILNSFSIITTVANNLLQKIPHHRSPVILDKADESTWLSKSAPLSDITRLLKPFSSEKMDAFPISNKIKNPKLKSRDLIDPIGDSLNSDAVILSRKELELKGMGVRKKFQSGEKKERK